MPRLSRCQRLMASVAYLTAALLIVSCRADNTADNRGAAGKGDTGGTLIVVLPAEVSTLLPPYAIAQQEKMAVGLLFDRLAEPGDSLNTIGDRGFIPRLADRWEWARDSLSIAFHLDPRARWHDGVPVRAHDVAFTYRLYVNPAAGIESASNLRTIDSVTTPDSLTAVFWFKQRYPEEFFDATYQILICPAHLLETIGVTDLRSSAFTHQPVGSGRFRFQRLTPGSTIELVSDTANYRGRAKLDRVVLAFTSNPGAAMTKLLAGDADVYEAIAPPSLPEVRQHPDIATYPYDNLGYGFLWFNLRTGTPPHPHPIFGDPAVRRALAMALDREGIVRNVYDTLGTVANGPFARSTSSTDYTAAAPPYDTARANHLLDSAGWRRGADGVRQKAGHPLAFSITVPTSSKSRQQIAVLIQDQLARVGARVSVEPVEMQVLISHMRARTFDAALQTWHVDGAMSDIRQMWTQGAEKDGVNWGSYESPTFDALVDSALTAPDPAQTHALLHRAYAVINEDVPAVWIFNTRQVAGVHRRVHIAALRPDEWYAHLADWYIPAASRIPRDNIGLAPTPQ
jgi:peptide/nickel transport system substrate-binding protein